MVRVRRLAVLLAPVVVILACAGTTEPATPAAQWPAVASSLPPATSTTALPDVALEEPGTFEPAGEPDVEPPTRGVPAATQAPDPVPVGAVRPRARASATIEPTGHIDIPAIGLSHPTYDGIEMRVIDRGPGHWPGTARPGERGNTVFPGHRTTHSRPFYDIDRLRPGHEVVFTTPAGRFTYRVTESFVVGSRETWIVDQTPDPTFTIFACHPKGSARQRYVVKGELVGPTPTTTTAPTTTTTEPRRRSHLDLDF